MQATERSLRAEEGPHDIVLPLQVVPLKSAVPIGYEPSEIMSHIHAPLYLSAHVEKAVPPTWHVHLGGVMINLVGHKHNT